MCGRYTLTSPDAIAVAFGVADLPFAQAARYNIAPSQRSLVVVAEATRVMPRILRWGISGAQRSGRRPLINARAETVHEKASFRDAFARRRCLVCADGFYEWKRGSGRAIPYLMRRSDGGAMAFAGIWEGDCFAILTTEANALMLPVHHRMPVIVSKEDWACWLETKNTSRSALEHLLRPPCEENYEFFRVSEMVNSAANDSAECLRPGPDQQSLF